MLLTPYKIKKAWRYLLHFGPKEFMNHLIERLEPEEVPYGPWYEKHKITGPELIKLKKENYPEDPLISVVVAAYETKEKYLRELIESVKAQSYEKWELCIADASDKTDMVERTVKEYGETESRIIYKKLDENKSISHNMNAGIEMSSGKYVSFLDHDDLIEPHVLSLIARQIRNKGADMIYTDEDKVTEDLSRHFQPNFKPDFNLDLLRSNNYITHFLCVKRELLDEAGHFNNEFDGSQDYDLIFRCSEKAKSIAHIPEILYHWRTHESSTADNPLSKLYAYEAGEKAIEAHLLRCGEKGEVTRLKDFGFYRVHYPVQGEPLVSVIIPNKDMPETLRACTDALFKSSYKNYEVIIVENGSTKEETFALYKELCARENVRVVTWKEGFNYSSINNFGATFAKGEYLLLLNNDIRTTITNDWLSEMLGVCQRKDVGVVGAKLYYPDDKIQHAGCVIGIGAMKGGGVAGAMFVGMPRSHSGYLHKASLMQDMSAVTAACMLVKKKVFDEAGGLTKELTVAFNDIDLCLKIREKGYLVVFDPYAEAYHDESKSRGLEDNEEKLRRFQGEIEYMRTRWIKILKDGDPYYNKNLTLKKQNYSLKP